MARKDRRKHLQPDAEKAIPIAVCGEVPKISDREPETSLNTDTWDIPSVSMLDIAFPSRYRDLLPPKKLITQEEWSGNDPFCKALSSIFFKGGALRDHNIYPKPGYDIKAIMNYIRATLGDYGPSHEYKIGGIAHALKHWCEIRG